MFVPEFDCCPICYGRPEAFKWYDKRPKLFKTIVEGFVVIILSFLNRYKCSICGSKFTYYPDFAIPYKQYIKKDIIEKSSEYLDDDNATYRSVVQANYKELIGYADKGNEIDERSLQASTVYRWVGFFSKQNKILTNSLEVIKAKSPNNMVFREIEPIPSSKYRSCDQKIVLQNAKRLLKADRINAQLFYQSIFPKFATGYL